MKKSILLVLFLTAGLSSLLFSQEKDARDFEKGVNLIETKTYSEAENAEILDLYKNLRVADVSDGLDMVGLVGTGLVNPEIHADWIDTRDLSHQIRGIAVTARYVPTQRLDRPESGQDFKDWEGDAYSTYTTEDFASIIKPGNVVVLDDVDEKDIGSIGSFNILAWHMSGAVGVVTDAGARDTDEIAIERVPLYLRKKGRGIRPGRNELESINRPVVIGGVLVCPGDVVVADGDGVVVVPRRVARQVAQFASDILTNDKSGRKDLYEQLDMPIDKTVK